METAIQAQEKSAESSEGFIRKVRKYNRRRFTAEDKIRVILDGMKREVAVSELCRKERIHPAIYYSWLKDFMEAGKARLRGDTKRSATENEVDGLRHANERLKLLLADLALDNSLLKKSLTGSESSGIS